MYILYFNYWITSLNNEYFVYWAVVELSLHSTEPNITLKFCMGFMRKL